MYNKNKLRERRRKIIEIEVGEYVRTKKGTIGKFKFYGKNDTSLIYFKTEYRQICVDDTEIVKHSKNICEWRKSSRNTQRQRTPNFIFKSLGRLYI